jgi:signal transduction histidine kinase
VRLFTELQEKNKALTTAHAQMSEAFEQQAATTEILRVISSSPTDVQPVFETIAESAMRLCGAAVSGVLRFDGSLIHLAAYRNFSAAVRAIVPQDYPMAPNRRRMSGRAILDRTVVHAPDVLRDPDYPQEVARATGWRSFLSVPMLREAQAIGAVTVVRTEPGPFSDRQIELLKTFADQAVIAIENVRLFTELQEKNHALTQAHAQVSESLDQQTATSEILRVISSSQTDAQPVFDTIARSAMRLCDGAFGLVTRLDGGLLHLVAHTSVTAEGGEVLRQMFPMGPGRSGVNARLLLEGGVVHLSDVQADTEYSQSLGQALRLRSALAVPMLRDGRVGGTVAVGRLEVRPFTDNEIALLQTFADQAVIAVENVRLFTELQTRNREIEEKSHQLEVASQHKSEFLANMSHELRTPLNAIIGFSEVLSERMFGELNEKQEEYSKDIHASGQHLLSLINDILDLSKIEAGRMELELTDFHLPTAVDNALTLVRERAGRKSIALQTSLDERLGEVRADERKVRQVVLNLLSNAIKFTPEGGRIEVAAAPKDGSVEVSVSDTGVGIAPADQEAVFEEFRQVGTAAKKVEGTGLGLTLCRKFVELHGGRIWVKSTLGVGSTFTFTIPLRHGE